jgi:N-sulfoglucosamine sulfohydrolase
MKAAPLTRRALLAAPALLRGAQARRPNILFAISDDQSYPHTSAYGTRWVKTPAFDRIAKEGVLFTSAFVSSPSCCPSRGSVLTGQDFYRLREASMNHTVWPGNIPLYTDLLADSGYHVGFTGKGWGPGNWQDSGRKTNPAGAEWNRLKFKSPPRDVSNIDYAANFAVFLDQRPKDAPFCFWTGFQEPHRPYDPGIGAHSGKTVSQIPVPGFLPGAPEVRGDLADYAYEIEWQDRLFARMLAFLEKRGELENTLIVVTSDNGMPFPRAKANLYDYGTRMPLAVRWGTGAKGGREVQDFVSFTGFAPTFLEAAGVTVPTEMTGQSLMPLLTGTTGGQVDPQRDHAVFGIERHFPGSRPGGAGYPSRAIRTRDHLYIRNLTPDHNPAGDHPGPVWPAGDPTEGYGDTDGSPTKTFLVENRERFPDLFRLAFDKRPAEELYEVRKDPYSLRNLADDPRLAADKKKLAALLEDHLKSTADPRATGKGEELDAIMKRYPTTGSNQGGPTA